MRQKIAHEGAEYVRGQVVEHGAFVWEEDIDLPVIFSNEWPGMEQMVGWASDIRREEDGVITAEISWIDQTYEGTTVFCLDAMITHEDDLMVVRHARITRVFIAPDVPWGQATVTPPTKFNRFLGVWS